MNEHEVTARGVKVTRLIATLERLLPGETPGEMADILADDANGADQVWTTLSRAAGVNPPSDETKRQVVVRLRLQQETRDKFAAMTGDQLFKGLT